jgi:hypothetical protein
MFAFPGSRRSGEFFIDLSKAQHALAFASLGVMKDGLRFNICDFKSSYLPNGEDIGLQERIQKCISPHLSFISILNVARTKHSLQQGTSERSEIIIRPRAGVFLA